MSKVRGTGAEVAEKWLRSLRRSNIIDQLDRFPLSPNSVAIAMEFGTNSSSKKQTTDTRLWIETAIKERAEREVEKVQR
jgi:hypothetical protein